MSFCRGSITSCILVAFLLLSVEARYRRHSMGTIPDLVEKIYGEVGRQRFQETWKEFNSRPSAEQDEFLMSDLSEEELDQLGEDFEALGSVLAKDPVLVDLFANFEHNLDTSSFREMDGRLNSEHFWWGRIKRFLYRKMEKLADEIGKERFAGKVL